MGPPYKLLLLLAGIPCLALDLTQATVIARDPSTRKAAQVLIEEAEKRSQVRWGLNSSLPGASIALVVKAAAPPEGFTIRTSVASVTIEGNDKRGILFGAGYLLRKLAFSRGHAELPADLNLTTAPQTPVRGHQLGYRPKTNSYDGWNVALWEQYIRDLAVFGVNTIELIPPHSDDAADSPHFPLPQMQMMIEMSRLANDYGLDVSIWYPALGDSESVWDGVFGKLPRIDNIFVPGGDPGHTQPTQLFALLAKQAEVLHRHHPRATMWVSPQGFNRDWMEEFYALVAQQPPWLGGIVYGPQNRDALTEVRKRVPARYPIRLYPDITHSLHSQFPVPDWDVAFALTAGREGINPRPLDHAKIFRQDSPLSIGFVTYSEGCNDDVNKFIWSGLGWDRDAKPIDILRDYSRYFIGERRAESFAQGVLALEGNWKGPLAANTGVDTTLEQFREMERTATPQEKLNWRFQQALYRAYYDSYERARLIAETAAEQRAMQLLREGAIDAAEAELDSAVLRRPATDLRARVFELAEALFQSIRMQLSVPRYQAIGVSRGANLDTIDVSLNNRVWLKGQLAKVRTLESERERSAEIAKLLNWTNPGPGGFYDDLGNPSQQRHLVRENSATGFGSRTPDQGWRVSWVDHAEALFDAPLDMAYHDLDPAAHYKVRMVYAGESPDTPLRLVANDRFEIHAPMKRDADPRPLEFPIPQTATQSGELRLRWTRPAGLGGSGRGTQVAEVWLIREP